MFDNYMAVIQAGGKGTRLSKLTGDKIPKPLLKVNGKPMIEWQIENIRKYGIQEFVIIIGHLGEKIKEYFEDGSKFGIHIRYIEEKEPLGSAGALYYLRELSYTNFLLVFGDVLFDIDIRRMIRFHEEKSAFATLLVHPNSHPFDSDLVVMDDENRVVRFDSKANIRDYWYDNCVNAGIYILSVKILEGLTALQRCDLEKDLLMPSLDTGRVFGCNTTEYVKDAGTEKRFYDVCEEQARGIWQARNLSHKQKCIFLDRDGTINVYKGLISQEDQLCLEESAADAIKLINSSGYLAIVVTNQPVVARGMCDVEDIVRINRKLGVLLGQEGAYLDDLVFCPHHPDKGYAEENVEYKISCSCRKPEIGMISEMAEKYNINISQSYMVGDSTVDIQTGINAGLKTVLVKTGQAGKDGKYNVAADYEADNLLGAIRLILSRVELE